MAAVCQSLGTMLIRDLAVINFRNIRHVHLSLSPGSNWFLGDNGAGKTAILESVDVLSRGRTFRTRNASPLIKDGEGEYCIQSTLVQGHTIDVRKSLRRARVMINGDAVSRRAETAALLPVQSLHPDSHNLIQGGAKVHQALLDWGVFHMKQSVSPCWSAYGRGLRQRNYLLRQQVDYKKIHIWDETIVEDAEKLSNARCEHLTEIERQLKNMGCFSCIFNEVSLVYDQGWPKHQSLIEAMADSYQKDIQYGYTRVGPHRAHINWMMSGMDVAMQASRGQQKMLIAAVLLAQIALFVEKTGKACLFLVDDLAAELDADSQQRVIRQIQALGIQALISKTSTSLPAGDAVEQKVFHVKQGNISDELHG